MKRLTESLIFNKITDTELLGNFNQSLKDEKFKKLIDKINLPYEELSKYTSILEDCAEEYNNCLNCKNIMECKNKVKGHAYLPKVEDKKISFGYKMCKKQEKLIKETKYLENVYSYEIPELIKRASMKDIYVDDKSRIPVIKWIDKYIKDYEKNKVGKGLYLSGSFGSGKTYLISAMFNELAKKEVKSAIIYWPEYLVNLKSSFGHDDYQEKIDKIKNVALLLIDDIGAETTTTWSRDEILGPILQHRMQANLPTFFTSNLSIELLEKHLASSKDGIEEVKARRIIERINQLTEKQDLIGKNYRK